MFGRDPFSEIEKMMMEMFMTPFGASRMTYKIGGGTSIEVSGKGFMPITVIEGDEHVKVIAMLPGVNKEDIVLNAVGDTLEIRAKRQPLMITESERIIYSEIPEDEEIYRTIKLPATVKEENASAKFENGMLIATLPKAEKSIKKGINIE
ncbi:Hsp20/alpha crystallin family protein [Methanotorris formicicus]|uniref:Heat shock protein Hsp20 n=1 Tax=Methanotorris formicicus Mc-S-70 TaxID=647171 RepID=H1L0D2_9EURY|nr:Hsp20/alpha crystallin family protein [Methanotorris formicicus]EHP85002.1 heat shock protein Hsp20 [Methanotorris formicicus Mc-S-70]